MERLKPIHVLEHEFRRRGAFLLVDVTGRTIRFYKYAEDAVSVMEMADSIKGRSKEMVDFLISRASVRG
jgi:hypothetical protein